MADIADIAQDAIDEFLAASLRNQQRRATITTQSTGFCLSCGAGIAEPGRRWCNAGCRDEWESARGR